MLNAYHYAITALNFSDDGKMLATYAYGDSTLNIWLAGWWVVLHYNMLQQYVEPYSHTACYLNVAIQIEFRVSIENYS